MKTRKNTRFLSVPALQNSGSECCLRSHSSDEMLKHTILSGCSALSWKSGTHNYHQSSFTKGSNLGNCRVNRGQAFLSSFHLTLFVAGLDKSGLWRLDIYLSCSLLVGATTGGKLWVPIVKVYMQHRRKLKRGSFQKE